MTLALSRGAYFAETDAPPSKSALHRALICAALAQGETRMRVPFISEDALATINCLRAMGADIAYAEETLRVSPIEHPSVRPALDACESGSTLRFLLPVASALICEYSMSGSGRLPERPISALLEALTSRGARFSKNSIPLFASGKLSGGEFKLPGDISSQFVSGVLLALPLIGGEIILTSPLEGSGYVNMTKRIMSKFGIRANGLAVPAQKYLSPGEVIIEGDYSNSAFFLAAGAISGRARVRGLSPSSPQGDKKILELLSRFGARVSLDGDCATVERGELTGFDIDVSDVPDLLPVLAIVAACAAGRTTFYNAARLRLKESDRILSTLNMLISLGIQASAGGDWLCVTGGIISGGRVDCMNDHRIAMSAAVASCLAEVIIDGWEAVNKSYPGFYGQFMKRM